MQKGIRVITVAFSFQFWLKLLYCEINATNKCIMKMRMETIELIITPIQRLCLWIQKQWKFYHLKQKFIHESLCESNKHKQKSKNSKLFYLTHLSYPNSLETFSFGSLANMKVMRSTGRVNQIKVKWKHWDHFNTKPEQFEVTFISIRLQFLASFVFFRSFVVVVYFCAHFLTVACRTLYRN